MVADPIKVVEVTAMSSIKKYCRSFRAHLVALKMQEAKARRSKCAALKIVD